jgi:Zn-dependent protease with chaperone function
MNSQNPTSSIDIRLAEYVRQRKAGAEAHLIDGIPDYAYQMDFTMRQKILAIPGVFPFFKALTSQVVPMIRQQTNLHALKIGPSQYPGVYEMVVDCARRLSIGIPTVFILPNPAEMNAGAYAMEDDTPLITITSGLMERSTPGELRTAIGHECGHIHNNHSIYSTAVNTVLEAGGLAIPGLSQLMALASAPIKMALLAWSRAAEVTCDRAGIICADDPADASTMMMKLASGGAFTGAELNIEAMLKQYDTLRATPVRYLEAIQLDHPVVSRRIFAQREFLGSEVLYAWRPEWRRPDMRLVDKEELDARCMRYISVAKSEKRSG